MAVSLDKQTTSRVNSIIRLLYLSSGLFCIVFALTSNIPMETEATEAPHVCGLPLSATKSLKFKSRQFDRDLPWLLYLRALSIWSTSFCNPKGVWPFRKKDLLPFPTKWGVAAHAVTGWVRESWLTGRRPYILIALIALGDDSLFFPSKPHKFTAFQVKG